MSSGSSTTLAAITNIPVLLIITTIDLEVLSVKKSVKYDGLPAEMRDGDNFVQRVDIHYALCTV
jgi:hypothetical protein